MITEELCRELGIEGAEIHLVHNPRLLSRLSTKSIDLDAFTERKGDMYIIYHKDEPIPRYVLAHELVHVQQMYRDELIVTEDRDFLWHNELYYKSCPYEQRPWEKDAFSKQKSIIKSLKKYED